MPSISKLRRAYHSLSYTDERSAALAIANAPSAVSWPPEAVSGREGASVWHGGKWSPRTHPEESSEKDSPPHMNQAHFPHMKHSLAHMNQAHFPHMKHSPSHMNQAHFPPRKRSPSHMNQAHFPPRKRSPSHMNQAHFPHMKHSLAQMKPQYTPAHHLLMKRSPAQTNP
jgi:hypothetical protein